MVLGHRSISNGAHSGITRIKPRIIGRGLQRCNSAAARAATDRCVSHKNRLAGTPSNWNTDTGFALVIRILVFDLAVRDFGGCPVAATCDGVTAARCRYTDFAVRSYDHWLP